MSSARPYKKARLGLRLGMSLLFLVCLKILLCFPVKTYGMPIPTDETDISRRLPLMFSSKNRIALPIRRAGNLILIKAKADTLEGNFILDTGAPYLVLNQTYFRNYRDIPEQQSVGINGEAQSVKVVEVDSLLIEGVKYKEIIADAANLSQIENRKGVRILGLLGVNMFLDFEMEIDLAHNVLYLNRLTEEGGCQNPLAIANKRNANFTAPVSLRRDVIQFSASINDRKLRFCFDTGAEYNVLSADVGKKVLEGITIVRRMKLYGSSGGSSEVLAGSINFLEIEGFRLANMQTILSDLEQLRKAYGSQIDGMIGYQLLSRGVVCINFKTKELRFYTLAEEG